MFKIRNTMLALAAIASLGLATLIGSTSSADARGFGGGFSRGGGGGHIGMRMSGPRIGGLRHAGFRHAGMHRRIGIHRHPNWCRWHGRCRVHVRWHRPWLYAAAPVAAVATYAAAPVAPRCTCLTKEYTQEGTVIFQDTCTKELASAPVGTTALPLPPATTTMPQSQTELQQPSQPQVR